MRGILAPIRLPTGIPTHDVFLTPPAKMASPPYAFSPSALSPEPAFEQQVVGISTKKRGATGSAAAPSLKRRKTSNMSVVSGASAHPLRQTSFPPDDLPTPFTARSPSIDMDTASLVSGSYVSGGVGTSAAPVKGKAKRGRKPKADKMGACDKTPSQAGGRALTAVSGASGGTKNNAAGGGGDAGAGDDDDAEAEADDAETAALATTRTDEDRKKERRLRAALVSCMDQDQYDRIAAWRAVKLPDAVIKRVSPTRASFAPYQSPPPPPLFSADTSSARPARKCHRLAVGPRRCRHSRALRHKVLPHRDHRQRTARAGRVDWRK